MVVASPHLLLNTINKLWVGAKKTAEDALNYALALWETKRKRIYSLFVLELIKECASGCLGSVCICSAVYSERCRHLCICT